MQSASNQPDDDWATVATIVDRFEELRSHNPHADLREFLPKYKDPLFSRIASELIRVDLEYSWNEGSSRRLTDYRSDTPQLFEDPDSLVEVAFEEYRMRRLAGEEALPEEYATQYGIETNTWPLFQSEEQSANDGNNIFSSDIDDAYPLAGSSFAGFRIVREIGRGTFARVYLAEQNNLALRNVVLKLSRRKSLEAEHLARLQHTNIMPIYSVHEASDFIAVCMPFYGEQTLGTVIRSLGNSDKPQSISNALMSTVTKAGNKTVVNLLSAEAIQSNSKAKKVKEFTEEEHTKDLSVSPTAKQQLETIIRLVRDIALGLSHAHARGIVHRDLKPANILIADDGRPLLLDFNLSNSAAVDGIASMTVGGTLPYMAPEHLHAVLQGGDVDQQADVYSLGVILFELLTGKRPYPDRVGVFDEVVTQSIRDRHESLSSISMTSNGEIPPSIVALVKKCLAPNPANRYQNADELEEDLSRHLEDLPLQHCENPSLLERFAKWKRRNPRVTSVSGISAISLVLVTLFAGLWLARTDQVAQLESQHYYTDFQNELPIARIMLSLPNSDSALLAEGLGKIDDIIGMYINTDYPSWKDEPRFSRLLGTDQLLLREQLAELLYLQSRAELILAEQTVKGVEESEFLESALNHSTLADELMCNTSAAIVLQKNTALKRLGRDPSSKPLRAKDNPIEDYLSVQSLLTEREFAAAAKCLKELRLRHPTDPVIWLLLGNALGGLNQLEESEAAFTMASSLETRSYVAIYNRALCRMQQKQPLAAIADFDLVLEQEPKLQCAMLNRSLASEAAGELDLALVDLDNVISSPSPPPRALLIRSRIRRYSGDPLGAEADLREGIALRPINELGWIARGIARLPNDPQGSLADFHEALTINPTSVLAFKNIVHVTADRLDLPNEAMEAFEGWLAIDDSSAKAMVGRGVLYARQGNREKSLQDIKAAIAISREPGILFQAACAYSLTSSVEQLDVSAGISMLSAAVDRDPGMLMRATTDPDLAKLRESKDYKSLLDAYYRLGQLKHDLNKNSDIMGNP